MGDPSQKIIPKNRYGVKIAEIGGKRVGKGVSSGCCDEAGENRIPTLREAGHLTTWRCPPFSFLETVQNSVSGEKFTERVQENN